MYKRKDFKKDISKDSSLFVWTSTDNRYFISTADVEEADWFAFVNTPHGWEEFYKGESFEDCLEQVNLHFETHG